MKDEVLLARLHEDTGSAEEAAQLLPVLRILQEVKDPLPKAEDTARLAESLRRILGVHHKNSIYRRFHFALLVLYSQLRVVQHEIWAASAIVMGLGMLVTLTYAWSKTTDVTLPFVLVAPLAAAAGIAFLYGPMVDPALEIELTLPVSPRQILTARMALVFGFDLIFGLTGSAVLSLLRADVSFWLLVSTWLAPMTFLASLAFLLVTITLDSGVCLMACFGLWIIQNLSRLVLALNLPFVFPDLTTASIRPWLWLLTVLFSGVALWLGGGEEHWLRKQA